MMNEAVDSFPEFALFEHGGQRRRAGGDSGGEIRKRFQGGLLQRTGWRMARGIAQGRQTGEDMREVNLQIEAAGERESSLERVAGEFREVGRDENPGEELWLGLQAMLRQCGHDASVLAGRPSPT